MIAPNQLHAYALPIRLSRDQTQAETKFQATESSPPSNLLSTFSQQPHLSSSGSLHTAGLKPGSFNTKENASPPPTPPPVTNASEDVTQPLTFKTTPNGSNASGFATPTNPKTPPTPDDTPPKIRDVLKNLSHSSLPPLSNYSDSFKTALEDQRSLHNPSSREILADEDSQGSPKLPLSDHNTQTAILNDAFLGMGESVTVAKPIRLRHKPDFDALGPLNGLNGPNKYVKRSPVFHDEGYKSLVVKSKTRQKSDEDNNHNNLHGNDTIPLLMRGLSLRDDSAHQAERASFSNGSYATLELPKPATPNGVEAKRHSGTSVSSTVIEAVVIDHTPPPSQRKLRHVSKTESLRDSASPESNRFHFDTTDSVGGSSRFRSVESSPALQSSHVLRRQKATITDKLKESREPSSRPVTAPHEGNTDEATDVLTTAQNQRRVVSDPLQIFRHSLEDVTPPPPSTSPASLAEQESFQDAPTIQLQRSSPISEQNENGLSVRKLRQAKANVEHAPVEKEDASRKSMYSTLSYDAHSTLHGVAMSPLSLRSDVTENIEINEAAAVTLSSHANSSLLVIHNTNSSEGIRRQTVAGSAPMSANSEGTIITLEPATPVDATQHEDPPHSPLRNPRAAPEPPSIAITSPNPAIELDGSTKESDTGFASEPRPSGHGSFFSRARRYSESFIHPFTGGFRRSRQSNNQRRSHSASRTSNVPDTEAQLDSQRHTQVLPSEQSYIEDDGWDDPLLVRGNSISDRPDVSNISPENEQVDNSEKWRRMGSIRGFLIGNSLGIERGPTNRRRHRVNLPKGGARNQNARTETQHPTDAVVTVRQSAKRSGTRKNAHGPSHPKMVFQSWRERMRQRKMNRQQFALERKRDALRNSIEGPFEHISTPTRTF